MHGKIEIGTSEGTSPFDSVATASWQEAELLETRTFPVRFEFVT
jgi:hypothetical protein